NLGGDASSGATNAEKSSADSEALDEILNRLANQLDSDIPGNIYMAPDLRVVIGNELYLIKPIERREWLVSTALADAEDLAAEFHVAKSGYAMSDDIYADG